MAWRPPSDKSRDFIAPSKNGIAGAIPGAARPHSPQDGHLGGLGNALRARDSAGTTWGDAGSRGDEGWLHIMDIFYVMHLKLVFCASEDTDLKIGNEGRTAPGEPYATRVAIFGDSKRVCRNCCPGGRRMVVSGRHGGNFGVADR